VGKASPPDPPAATTDKPNGRLGELVQQEHLADILLFLLYL
jgi:hypothetical protein